MAVIVVYLLSHVQLLQLCGLYVTCQALLGFSRQEHQNGLLFPSPGDLPNTGIEPAFPTLAGRFFTAEPARKSRLYSEDLIKQKFKKNLSCFNMFCSNVCQVTYTQRVPCPLSRLRHTHILVTVSA